MHQSEARCMVNRRSGSQGWQLNRKSFGVRARKDKQMGDPNYKRTTGGKNQCRRRIWRARVQNAVPELGLTGTARLKSGAQYQVQADGSWRRLKVGNESGR